MDPLSISASISTLLVGSTRIIQLANNLRLKYQSGAMAMANIASECSIVNVALAQLQAVFAGADLQSYKTEQGGEDILRSFDAVTMGCSMTHSLLEQHLADAVKRDGVESLSLSNGVSRKDKAKFVWNEDEIKDLLLQLRGYQTSLTLLLNVLHKWVMYIHYISPFS